ncbi:MAG: DUF4923 family protein [Rikenellaceae bacterium]
MRKIIATTLLLCGCMSIQAQSLTDLFKAFTSSSSSSTDTSEEVEVSTIALSETSMLGSWNFTQLAVDLSDDSALKGFAGTAVIKQVESLLNSVASSSGISENMFTIIFSSRSDATISFKDSQTTIKPTYSIDTTQNTISIDMGKVSDIEVGILTANVTLSGDSATLLVDAKALIAVADQVPDIASNTQYSMIKSVATSVDGLLMGFVVQKQ